MWTAPHPVLVVYLEYKKILLYTPSPLIVTIIGWGVQLGSILLKEHGHPPCRPVHDPSSEDLQPRQAIYGPKELPTLWFHIPHIVIAYGPSNGPQNHIGN